MLTNNKSLVLPTIEQALPGRDTQIKVSGTHFVSGHPLMSPFPDKYSQAMFGLGCFWGAEKKFWLQKGVFSTMVGYAAGHTKNPTYHEVCSGMTAHNEVVRVIYDEAECSYEELVKLFYESHNPTQAMQQGNDIGTQYRSGIYYYTAEQQNIAELSTVFYQKKLSENNYALITTEINKADVFYYAEDYHQQYLAKNPNGYCGLGGLGVRFE